jgi:hypothetical protein
LALAGICSCSDSWSPTVYSLRQPTSLALACAEFPADGSAPIPLDLAQCKKGTNAKATLRAFVGNSRLGSVNILNLTRSKPVDMDKSIPGYTGLKLGENVADLWARPDGTVLLAAESTLPAIFVVPLPEATLGAQVPLDSIPLFFLDTGANPRLFAAVPSVMLEISAVDGTVLATTALPDEPSDASWNPDTGEILVTYRHLPQLQVLDSAGVLLRTIGIGLPCADGLDNDGDGLVDGAQPSCHQDLRLARETAPDCVGPDCELAVCGDGLDNDGDGLADALDPGCSNGEDSSEAEDLSPCADGFDNDSDELVDSADPDCAGAAVTEDGLPLVAGPLDRTWFPCADGLDNDHDGSTDQPQDGGCLLAGFSTESGLPAAFAKFTVLPGQRFAYVYNAGLAEILVVDLDAGAVVELYADLTRPGAFARKEGRRGFPFAAPVTDLGSHTLEDGSVEVVVTSSDGTLTAIKALDATGQPVHTLVINDQDPDDSQVGKPHLYDNGQEIELGYTPRAGYPHFGPLTVLYNNDGSHTWYGIKLSRQNQEHRSETWSLAYEGVIPGADRLFLRHRAGGRFEVPTGRLCDLGILAGDKLLVTLPEEVDFGGFLADQLEFPIVAVGSDWLETDPEDALARAHADEWVSALASVATSEPGGAAALAALPGAIEGQIRAGNTFLLTGSRTGLLHAVEDGPEGCRVRPAAGSGGRVAAPKVKPGVVPAACPIVAGDPAGVATIHSNPEFSFNLYPACAVEKDGSISAVAPARGMDWRFAVSSGFSQRRLLLGGLPLRLVQVPALALDLVIDPALLLIKSLDLEDFSLEGYYY